MLKLIDILNEIEIDRSQELLKLILNNKEEISSNISIGFRDKFLKGKPKIFNNGKVQINFDYYDPLRFIFSFNPIGGMDLKFKINNKTIHWTVEDRTEGYYGNDGEWHDDSINEIEINPYPLEVGTQFIYIGSDGKVYIGKVIKMFIDIIARDSCQIEWKKDGKITGIDTKDKDIILRWLKKGTVKYYYSK